MHRTCLNHDLQRERIIFLHYQVQKRNCNSYYYCFKLRTEKSALFSFLQFWQHLELLLSIDLCRTNCFFLTCLLPEQFIRAPNKSNFAYLLCHRRILANLMNAVLASRTPLPLLSVLHFLNLIPQGILLSFAFSQHFSETGSHNFKLMFAGTL